MTYITNYNQYNKKLILSLIGIFLISIICLIISVVNFSDDIEFYKYSKNVNALIKNKENKDNKNIIRVSYKVEDKIYSTDIIVTEKEFMSLHTGDMLEIFYNEKNPIENMTTKRSVASVLFIIVLLVIVIICSIVFLIIYYSRIRTNRQLIRDNVSIETKFYRMEIKKSLLGSENIYYIYCKGKINNELKTFKSIGIKNKPKPLNDTSIINVYINNKGKYLVNIDGIL